MYNKIQIYRKKYITNGVLVLWVKSITKVNNKIKVTKKVGKKT